MNARHLPTIEALTNGDDERLREELRLRELREHVAEARSLLDEVDRLAPAPIGQQLSAFGHAELVVEELARLGCKFVEVATALSRAQPPASGDDPDAPDPA